ncbi:MAG: matrixin family metalloprotease [Sulfitobacter sp.]|nr:matrixin family metalloprotease [Sulfitobacter sp.]
MAFSIKFDYRFDSTGFFNDPARRTTLEGAAAEWETLIGDEFADVPAEASFEVSNPSQPGSTERVTLTERLDDILIFVGARNIPGSTAAFAGPTGYSLFGDVYSARISNDFRGSGPVSNFEPWAGQISFDTTTNWHYGLDAPPSGKLDLFTLAIHEIGHVLGIGTSSTFNALIAPGNPPTFNGVNTMALNGGRGVPLDRDEGHIQEGFSGNSVVLDPILERGTRLTPSAIDRAMLADIGYKVTGFAAQGNTPAITTNAGESIRGTDLDDAIDAVGGNDVIFGEGGNDTIRGGSGNDQLQGEGGDDHLIGDTGADTLFGQSGADLLEGGPNNDQLQGGQGADTLTGGSGKDSIFGHDGVDTFRFSLGGGQDLLYDFDVGSELLQLVDSGFSSTQAALSAVSKPFSNVSRITLRDGSKVDIYHTSQSGTPLHAGNVKVVSADGLNRRITGTDGDETLTGGGGDDTLEGGRGNDTARYDGPQVAFTLTLSYDQTRLTDRRPAEKGGQGTDLLRSIEFLDFGTEIAIFDGSPMKLDIFDGPTTLNADEFFEIIELYIAYFNRAPDALGLSYWATLFADGFTLPEMAASFFTQVETRAAYAAVLDPAGNLDLSDPAKVSGFVAAVYDNVLGRIPDGPGFEFWVDKLQNDPAVTPGAFIMAIIGGAKFAAEPTAQTFVDREYLATKADLGAYFAVIKGMSDVADAAASMALFDGSRESRDAARVAIDRHYADALDAETGDFLMPLVGVMEDPFLI